MYIESSNVKRRKKLNESKQFSKEEFYQLYLDFVFESLPFICCYEELE